MTKIRRPRGWYGKRPDHNAGSGICCGILVVKATDIVTRERR